MEKLIKVNKKDDKQPMNQDNQLVPKIIIVDDDNMSRLLLTKTISSAGFDVVSFVDGKKAIKYIDELHGRNTIAAIISDLMMLDSDGIDLLAHVRSKPTFDSVPFFFITGAELEVFQNLLKPYKYQGFINKPVTPTSILKILGEHLQLPHKAA